MPNYTATVVSVHRGNEDVLEKRSVDAIEAQLDGIVDDRHRGFERQAWEHGDKQPGGTLRRNERQWSAVSVEELEAIREAMSLTDSPGADTLGANLCIDGVPELSRLPKGSTLTFPSGAVLVVEEYNPPCLDMGASLADLYTKSDGSALTDTDFSKAAKLTRGVVGIVDVPGTIRRGDSIEIDVYRVPAWLERSAD